MKRVILLVLCVALLLSLCGCWQSYYDDKDELIKTLTDNHARFLAVAQEAMGYGNSTYISTTEYYRPENAPEELNGLYVYDTLTEEVRALSSEAIDSLFTDCKVNSLGVKIDDTLGVGACEFSMGGGDAFYNGVYYVTPDRPVFLNDLSLPLAKTETGYEYRVEKMNFYTEKCFDNFYYYAAEVN